MIVHNGDHVLASDVEFARSQIAKARGLIGRKDVPEGYALVFSFDSIRVRSIHMFGVRTPIDVVWVADDRVQKVETLSAWWGFGLAKADTVIELAPGATDAIDPGDRVEITG